MGPELSLGEEIGRILLVAVLAGAVGIERELREQEAGLRTHMLVGVGAALFVIAGTFSWSGLHFGNGVGIVLDPSRVIAYVVTGVGFLGAGAIIKNGGGGGIRGLTTAASLWVVAAIGVVVASGQYALGVFATAVVLMSLWPVKRIARFLGLRRGGSRRLVLELGDKSSIGDVLAVVERTGVEMHATTVREVGGARRLEIVLSGREIEVLAILDRLPTLSGVRSTALDS
jgi:putative Mg2+ transporter-C (MgtC) family protein